MTTNDDDFFTVDRILPGFEDFADDGVRAIEPGSPSRSLLYTSGS